MRDIKFRAWDNSSKIMYLWSDFHKWSGDEIIRCINQKNAGEVLMQYTGLKDKNGKEIYEGDIVKSGNGRLWTIEFGNFVSTIPPRIEVSGYGYYIQPIEKECKEKGNGCLYAGLEVIGNIYENPELLTPTDKEEK